MTSQALTMLAAAIALLAAALSTGGALYYLLAALLLTTLLLSFLTCFLTLVTLKVNNISKSARATRGESVALRLAIRRGSVLPVAAVILYLSSPQDDISETRLPVTVPPLQKKEYRCLMRCPHRGEYEAGVTRAAVTDVLRLFTLRKRVKAANTFLFVLPRDEQAEPLVLEPGDRGVESRARATEDTASPSDVRAWQDGDTLKKVHWKLTMRKHDLMVRTYEESMRSDTLILLDTTPLRMSRAAQLTYEDALCEGALGAARAQLLIDHPVRVPVAGKNPFELSGQNAYDYPRFQEAFSHLKFDSEYSYEQYLAVEMRRSQRSGGAALITARLSAEVAETALRMRRMNMLVSLTYVCEGEREDEMAMLERLRIDGIRVKRVNPWDTAITDA